MSIIIALFQVMQERSSSMPAFWVLKRLPVPRVGVFGLAEPKAAPAALLVVAAIPLL